MMNGQDFWPLGVNLQDALSVVLHVEFGASLMWNDVEIRWLLESVGAFTMKLSLSSPA